MGCCVIFCAAEFDALARPLEKDDYIIAADGGWHTCRENGITPTLLVADFDSLDTVPEFGHILRLPVEKDDTDSMLAIREGLARGCTEFYFYGATGGHRLDHTLANLQSLAFLRRHGARGYLYHDNFVYTVIENEHLTVRQTVDWGLLSIFNLGADAEGLNDLVVFQRGALTVRRQKWQPCRAGKFCQRRGPRGRKHLGIKSVDIAFECLQHKTVPSVDLKFFTELLYVPPAAEPAENRRGNGKFYQLILLHRNRKGPLCEGAPPTDGGGETAILYALSLSPLRGQRPHKRSLSLLLIYIRSRQLFQTSILRKKSVVRVIHRRCLGGGRLGGKTLDIRPQCRGGPQLAAAHSAAAVETAPAVSVCHSSSPSA